jgi:ribonuclease VapC
MIVDSSALVAILFLEPEAGLFTQAIIDAEQTRMSAANLVEASIVIDRSNKIGAAERLDEFLAKSGMIIEPVTAAQAHRARLAYLTYGKGNHRAALNLGDVFAYALAMERGEPLLYKGRDFSLTDVMAAVPLS